MQIVRAAVYFGEFGGARDASSVGVTTEGSVGSNDNLLRSKEVNAASAVAPASLGALGTLAAIDTNPGTCPRQRCSPLYSSSVVCITLHVTVSFHFASVP